MSSFISRHAATHFPLHILYEDESAFRPEGRYGELRLVTGSKATKKIDFACGQAGCFALAQAFLLLTPATRGGGSLWRRATLSVAHRPAGPWQGLWLTSLCDPPSSCHYCGAHNNLCCHARQIFLSFSPKASPLRPDVSMALIHLHENVVERLKFCFCFVKMHLRCPYVEDGRPILECMTSLVWTVIALRCIRTHLTELCSATPGFLDSCGAACVDLAWAGASQPNKLLPPLGKWY